MSEVVIKVEDLSKQYRLGTVSTGTIAHDLNRWWQTSILGREDPYLKIGEVNDRAIKNDSEYVWALRNINFQVAQGEVLGIIGRNGAGKSTLLKILSRTTSPTTGSVKIKGRVASLLEVGTGFHGELTGRENIFLNGAILGMTKAEIKRKLDEIIDFSGVEKYVDTPVKRYSSGMYVRLAFGVAAYLEPDILIVDEVLAVGDAEFQKKALGKMKDVSTKDGRTVLFVSHNIAAIRQLCNQGLLLNNGNVELYENTNTVIKQYLQKERNFEEYLSLDDYRDYHIENSPVIINAVEVEGTNGLISDFPITGSLTIKIQLKVQSAIKDGNITIAFTNSEQIKVGLAFSWDDGFYFNAEEAGNYEVRCVVKNHRLSPEQYFIHVGINQSDITKAWDGISNYPIFNIIDADDVKYFKNRPWGTNHFSNNEWTSQKC